MEQISIEPLQAAEIPQTAVVAARAFSTNPLFIAVSRDRQDKEHYLEVAFSRLLEHMPGQVFLVKKG